MSSSRRSVTCFATIVLIVAGLGIPAFAQSASPSPDRSETAIDRVAALTPATRVDVSSGSGTGTGTVSNGHQVFSFEASEGDRVTLAVEVTETLPGSTYSDNDSQLFVFNRLGRLLAENDDDGSSYQSLIDYVVIPADGTYYAVVTTWPNTPVLNGSRVITTWNDNGYSNIRFNLIITGITPKN